MGDLVTPSGVFGNERSGAEIVPGEPLASAFRRMTVHVADQAIHAIRSAADADLDAAVHDVRKKTKRLRALLRLVRDQIGPRSYRYENEVLRDTARRFADVRDAAVMVETVRGIRTHYADLLDRHTFGSTERWLLTRHARLRASVTTDVLDRAAADLSAARSRYMRFPVEQAITDDFAPIAGGLRRVYRRGRRAHVRSLDTPSNADLHEWRKRVKYLRYQLEALAPLRPALVRPLAGELEGLGELLGEYHDAALLTATVAGNEASCRDDRERWMLLALVYERQLSLRRRAFTLGRALYHERPSAFAARMQAYCESGVH